MARSALPVALSQAIDRTLPSGRSIQLKLMGKQEEIEVRSPAGEVEVRITFTAEGPVVSVRAARLELGAKAIALACDTFEVAAEKGVSVESAQEIRLNGSVIRLNCTEESA